MAERRVIITTDAAADLPASEILRDKYGIGPIPQAALGVSFGDEHFRTDTLSPAEYLRKINTSGVIPKTGALSTGYFVEFFQQATAAGLPVLSLHLGDNMSGVGDQARTAAKEIGGDKVEIYNTGTVSMAQGFLAIAAEEAAMNGASREEIVRLLDEKKADTKLRVVTPNIPFIEASGRVSHLMGRIGTILRINPVLQIDSGKVDNVSRERTMGKALGWIVNYAREMGVPARVAVVDFEAEEDAVKLAERLKTEAQIPDASIIRTRLGYITSSHGGPGTVGMAIQTGH